MIELKNPPYLAHRVLHMNCSSSSPGGKDYVLFKLADGKLWAVNGPAFNVRSGRGAIQHPNKPWQEMVAEKTRKGYQVIGEYNQGSWWSSSGDVYKDVQHIPVVQPKPQPEPDPEPVKPQTKQRQPASLAEQYPVSTLVLKAFEGSSMTNEWFCLI